MAELHDLGGALKVNLERGLVGAVVHDGGKTSVDSLEAVLVGAVIEVHGNRNGDVHVVNKISHDVANDLEAHLPLGGTSGALNDNRSLELLGGLKNGARPLEVVGVEGGDAVVTLYGGLEHSGCINEHVLPPDKAFYVPTVPNLLNHSVLCRFGSTGIGERYIESDMGSFFLGGT